METSKRSINKKIFTNGTSRKYIKAYDTVEYTYPKAGIWVKFAPKEEEIHAKFASGTEYKKLASGEIKITKP